MAETQEEYARRISRVPGVFGDGDATASAGGAEKLKGEETKASEEDPDYADASDAYNATQPVGAQEETQDETVDVQEKANTQEEPNVPYLQTQEEEEGTQEKTLTSSIFDNDESEIVEKEPEKRRAEDVVKDVSVANSVEEVDSLVKDDERRTVIKAANKRREDLTQDGDDE